MSIMVANTVITLRMDNALKAQVDTVAKELGRSRAWVINKALVDYIEDVEDIEIAKQRMADPKDAVVSLNDAMAQL
ncbi:ribbon-helix-helix protein, CopG family [Candidatus Cryosericum odellii]|uniref:Ribbon-helix-helix protein, CopG family n=2 Tax=Candidatus Cryosericum odellii TaxID=2290917 RepID=A0A398D6M0_9BACT|nr:ribbon-helix-helix protein, CopG family [Candidatus Cryosericum odellii]